VRVLFTTTPGRGHYNPMLGLASACRDRGHDVTWAAHETACVQLRKAGFETVPAGLPETLTSEGLAERYPELMALDPAERPNFLFAKIFGPERAGPMLDDLLPIVAAHEPALLVCDQAELAGPIAAALAGIPNVTHGFGHPLPEERVARAAQEMAGSWAAHGLAVRPFAGTYDHLYVDIYPASMEIADSAHIGEIQRIRPAAAPAPEAPASPWADADEPLIYVTFGTVFNSDIGVIRTVLEGVSALPVRVVFTCGPGRDVRALGDLPANVHVADYIPQAQLLPHCTAVASHAGSGTFLAALANGLPQLLLPQAADQFLNATAGARAGAAIAIEPGRLSAAAVTEALAELLADPAHRLAAQRLGAEIEAMPSPDAVARELERRFA
jgi:UDP:flavonoid glycosyltransferase YjiC (YdhE family)